MFFFKQKTAYEMRISDWSSDVCSSDLNSVEARHRCDPDPGKGGFWINLAGKASVTVGRNVPGGPTRAIHPARNPSRSDGTPQGSGSPSGPQTTAHPGARTAPWDH